MQMSQSIFGRGLGGGGCVVMWASPDILVRCWIEHYSWLGTKNCSISFISKSKNKIANECIIFPPHNSFSVDPSTEMFTDSYHSPPFSHLCLDMFQKTGPFHLPSRCEEICSLMAFKTGSTDNKKKGEVRRTLSSPAHPPASVDASFAELSAQRTAAVPRCQLCQSHWPPSAGNLIPSLQPPRTPTEWVRSVTVKSECHSRLRLGIVFRVCVLLCSLFTAVV